MGDSSKAAVQRPNSFISLGSSFSSSTSRSSGSSSSSNSNTNTRNAATLSMELDMINESLPLKTENNSKKYQRSTTLVSQLSMGKNHRIKFLFCNITFPYLWVHFFVHFIESGIIADISSSPDNEVQTSEENTTWSKASASYLHPHKAITTTSSTNNMSQKLKTLNANITSKLHTIDNDDMNANATANPYINNDSIAVHL